jgi:hypothetical protein
MWLLVYGCNAMMIHVSISQHALQCGGSTLQQPSGTHPGAAVHQQVRVLRHHSMHVAASRQVRHLRVCLIGCHDEGHSCGLEHL